MQVFTVSGMTCNHCKMSVKKAILELDQSAEVRVNLNQGLVEINSKLSRALLSQAILDAGYEVAV